MELKSGGAIALKAFAKINLGLDVTGARPDGYHEIRSVMQSVYLHDEVALERMDTPGVTLNCNLKFLPRDEKNIACRAAGMLTDEFKLKEGVHITLHKAIPVSSGLAGGSSDAAAVLRGMDKLFGLGLSMEELKERGKKLGADVPFCLTRGTMLAEGIGEKLTALPQILKCAVLIAKPRCKVSTKKVYEALNLKDAGARPDFDAMVRGLEKGDLRAVGAAFGNVLESVTIPKYPVIKKIKNIMKEEGSYGALMSGSGPAVFGIFGDKAAAKEAYGRIRAQTEVSRIYLTYTCGAEEKIYIR